MGTLYYGTDLWYELTGETLVDSFDTRNGLIWGIAVGYVPNGAPVGSVKLVIESPNISFSHPPKLPQPEIRVVAPILPPPDIQLVAIGPVNFEETKRWPDMVVSLAISVLDANTGEVRERRQVTFVLNYLATRDIDWGM